MKIQYVIKTFGSRFELLGYLLATALLWTSASGFAVEPLLAEHLVVAISPALRIAHRAPSLNPPHVERPEQPETRLAPSPGSPGVIPSVEWTYHRTADGQHPNGDEQQIMWLMNRARQNPAAEGVWLATAPEFAIDRNYFQVNTQLLQTEFASYAAKPPAAFDMRLYNAAKAHSDDLIARDAQDHNNQFERIDEAGFLYWAARVSVFSYADNALHTHGAWNIR
jgi:hypothetical protein